MLFDRNAILAHFQRAEKNWDAHDFLWRRVAETLQDRLLDIKRDFPVSVEIGFAPMVLTPEFCARKKIAAATHLSPFAYDTVLPLEPNSIDLIVSLNHLHWTEDLPGLLLQMRHALKPDGLLLFSLIGGETLFELRGALSAAESDSMHGISPRISPFVQLQDMAALLQHAGFALPVADNEIIHVTYKNVSALVRDIRGMGQSNAVAVRRRAIPKKNFWPLVERYYRTTHALPDGRLNATVEIICGLGWAPDPSQPQPLKRGSALVQLSDILQVKN